MLTFIRSLKVWGAYKKGVVYTQSPITGSSNLCSKRFIFKYCWSQQCRNVVFRCFCSWYFIDIDTCEDSFHSHHHICWNIYSEYYSRLTLYDGVNTTFACFAKFISSAAQKFTFLPWDSQKFSNKLFIIHLESIYDLL